jgi:hypothetical protein
VILPAVALIQLVGRSHITSRAGTTQLANPGGLVSQGVRVAWII